MLTIFCDKIQIINKNTWAEVSKVYRPGHQDTDRPIEEVAPYFAKGDLDASKVGVSVIKRGNGLESVDHVENELPKYNIPVKNRFTNLCDDEDNSQVWEKIQGFDCDTCSFSSSTKSMLNSHKKIHKTFIAGNCNCLLSSEYDKAIKEIRLLRSQLEKTKNEMKILKDSKHMEQNNPKTIGQIVLENRQDQVRQSVITLRCQKCSFTTKTLHQLNDHMKNHNREVFNCQICDVDFDSPGSLNQRMLNEHQERLIQLDCHMCSFQSTENSEFKNHMSKHGETESTVSTQINQWKCRNCSELFQSKWFLMEHRRDNHEMPLCRYDIDGGCNRPIGKCWYKHKSNQSLKETNLVKSICYSCKEEFAAHGDMMEHRKFIHPEIVKTCFEFLKGECKKEKCWFLHKVTNSQQGFQLPRTQQETP